MKLLRKEFLKLGSLAGLGMIFGKNRTNKKASFQKLHDQSFNMHGYTAPKLDTVRIGFIGIGSFGSGVVHRYAGIEGVDIRALCDIVPHRVSSTIESIKTQYPMYNPDSYTDDEDDWKRLCEREDIDLICISTPWSLHAEMAIYAMEHDKHVYVDQPVGVTVEEIWQVVETSENTRKHCYMQCNSCHFGIGAVLLNMARQGFFGDIIHGEGHYIHDRVSNTRSRWVKDEDNNNWFGYRPWRLQENVNRNGNLYPSHRIAPISQIMDLNYGDQMDYIVSISSNDFTLADKMKEVAEMDDYFKPYVGLEMRGNINTSIIRTRKGRTIMLQHDISTPRPTHHQFDLISGTKAFFESRPDRIAMGSSFLSEEELNSLITEYTPQITNIFNEKIRQANSRITGRGSYSTTSEGDWRLIDILRNGLPLEIDVYDGALWSVVSPMSEWSVAREGTPVKIPDFTRGAWKTNKRGMDVSIQEGGTTNLI